MKRQMPFIVATIIATLFIFNNSFQPANISDASSNVIVDYVENVAGQLEKNIDRKDLTHAVRKSAHVLEFTLQAILIAGCFSTTFRRRIIYVLFLGLLTACLDEYIQLFSPGRASMIQDVFIDFCGTIIGLFIFGLSCKFKGK